MTAAYTTGGCPVDEAFDPLSADHLADPYAVRAALPAGGAPVFYAPSIGYYVVTRYADVERVFRDPQTYSAAVAQAPLVPLIPSAQEILLAGGQLFLMLRDEAGQRDAGVDAELLERVAQVPADGVRGDVEPLGHLPGGQAVGYEPDHGELGTGQRAAYAATKGGVEAMTFILAHELRGRDITVNAVAPGPTATPMFLDGKDDEAIARFASPVPLERLGTPADIAEVVAFLTSPAGHWINGQTIRGQRGHQTDTPVSTVSWEPCPGSRSGASCRSRGLAL